MTPIWHQLHPLSVDTRPVVSFQGPSILQSLNYSNMKYRKGSSVDETEDSIGLDGGADLPQAFAEEPSHPKAGIRRARAEQRSRGNTNNSWMLPFGILMVLVLVASYFLVSQHEDNLVQHLKRDEQIHEQEMSREFDVKYSELKEENIKLKRQIQQYEEMKQKNEHLINEGSSMQDAEKNIEHLTAYKKKMQENIQLMSKTALLEK